MKRRKSKLASLTQAAAALELACPLLAAAANELLKRADTKGPGMQLLYMRAQAGVIAQLLKSPAPGTRVKKGGRDENA